MNAIKIPCRVWPSRDANQNGSYDHFPGTNSNYISQGIRCPKSVNTDLFFRMSAPIPTGIHASTPAGKIHVTYIPLLAASANSILLNFSVFYIDENETADPSSFTDEESGTFAVGVDADVEKWASTFDLDLTLNAASQQVDTVVAGRIQRLGEHATDTYLGDIGIVQVLYIGTDDT